MCRGTYQKGPLSQLTVDGVVGIGSPAPSNARTIRFIIDTGATSTLISATDAVRLGLNYDSSGIPHFNGRQLTNKCTASGIGGTLRLFVIPDSYLTLVSTEKRHKERHTEYIRELLVAEAQYQDESLLGMDLLQRFNILIDSHNSQIDLSRIYVKGTTYFVQNS